MAVPTQPLSFTFGDRPRSLHEDSLSLRESVLDNATVGFSVKGAAPRGGKQSALTPPADEKDADYIQNIEETITTTWLVVYSAIIRVMDFLVSISLSYESHALSLLRACSIVALAICCGSVCAE